MRTIFIPHLDDLISSLNYRFMTQKETIISLQYILPSLGIDKSFLFIREAVDFYMDDLSICQVLKVQLRLSMIYGYLNGP